MTAAEFGVLLLCTQLDEADRPLSMAQFRDLSIRAQNLGLPGEDLSRDVQARDLLRLGYKEEEAAHIVALLSRESTLGRYLSRAGEKGIVPLTRISAAYPSQPAQKLGVNCPPVLYCKGDLLLLQRNCISVVGSRQLHEQGQKFAETAGRLIAEAGLTLCSGGADGADTAAQEACLAAGGTVIVYTAGRLTDCPARERMLYVSESGCTLPFSTPRAMSRNRLIHVTGEMTLAAQTHFGTGGTWYGSLDNLKHGWSPLYVSDDGSEGAQALMERGAVGIRELHSLADLQPEQQSLF